MADKKSFADYWRQLDFYNPERDANRVLIVGAGSTGSFVAYGLARMGVKDITVCDFDGVEAHNLPNQLFAESIIDLDEEGKSGILKVVALQQTLQYLLKGIEMKIIPDKVENISVENRYDIVISAVDSMIVRRWIFDNIKCRWLIDPRTGGEFFRVIAVDLADSHQREYYLSTLHSDGEAAPLPCTGTAIMDVVYGVSAEVIQRYRKIVSGKLRVLESFHDFNVGGSAGIMKARNTQLVDTAAPAKSQEFIALTGTAEVREYTNES